ncbi:MAG: hypothetical protein N3D74_00940 [Caldisericia bacterium]|nr:hypothetical protein [Caldisericia bacterium]
MIKTNEGGKITPSGEINVEFGSSIEFIIIPDSGFLIKDVYVNGESFGPVKSLKFL